MTTIEVTTIGNSKGVVLSAEILERLQVQEGDRLYVIETPNGIELSPYDPELAEQLRIGEQIMCEHDSLLRRLAE